MKSFRKGSNIPKSSGLRYILNFLRDTSRAQHCGEPHIPKQTLVGFQSSFGISSLRLVTGIHVRSDRIKFSSAGINSFVRWIYSKSAAQFTNFFFGQAT